MVLIGMCFSLLLGLGGCKKESKDVEPSQKVLNFSTLTPAEQTSFIEDYLKTKYGINSEIVGIRRNKKNYFLSDDTFFAIAKCDDGSSIDCWIDENGEISDSKFLNDLEESINQLFNDKIQGRFHNAQVICSCTLNSPTDNEWTEESIEQMLSSEDITVKVRIFVDRTEADVANELVGTSFGGVFSFVSGDCYIYLVEDANSIENREIPLTQYDMRFQIKRD